MGLLRGISHTEFIKGDDGKLYFSKTAAYVGGGHIADPAEAATGLDSVGRGAKIEMHYGKLPCY